MAFAERFGIKFKPLRLFSKVRGVHEALPVPEGFLELQIDEQIMANLRNYLEYLESDIDSLGATITATRLAGKLRDVQKNRLFEILGILGNLAERLEYGDDVIVKPIGVTRVHDIMFKDPKSDIGILENIGWDGAHALAEALFPTQVKSTANANRNNQHAILDALKSRQSIRLKGSQ